MSKFTNFPEAFGELRAQKFRRKDRQIIFGSTANSNKFLKKVKTLGE